MFMMMEEQLPQHLEQNELHEANGMMSHSLLDLTRPNFEACHLIVEQLFN